MHRRGKPITGAYQPYSKRIRPDAHQQAFAGPPHVANGLIFAVVAHLRIDTLRGTPQRELAQRNQIALAKKVADRPFGLLRQVNLAFAQPFQQIVRRQIDELDLVSALEHRIGHRFPNANLGDAADDIVQAFEVLDVERRVNVDAAVEQLLDIVPAFRMARALGVGMSQLINQDQCRVALERTIEVELAYLRAAILDDPWRQNFEAFQQRDRFCAAVSFRQADHHIAPLGALFARFREHGVGFANAGGSAEEDFEPPATAFGLLALDLGEQCVGIWTLFAHRFLFLRELRLAAIWRGLNRFYGYLPISG